MVRIVVGGGGDVAVLNDAVRLWRYSKTGQLK
jgi:hypothetical protein